jgi:uncharacterized beta-barrel protein YwiB (DUF1934 family)
MSIPLKKEKDVIVRITTRADGEQFVTEARGEYASDSETRYIAFTEYSGNTITRNGLHAARDRLFLHRTGAVNSDMLFDPGAVTRSEYETCGMKTAFLVHTEQYSLSEQPGKIVILLNYSLYEGTDRFAAPFELVIEIIDA